VWVGGARAEALVPRYQVENVVALLLGLHDLAGLGVVTFSDEHLTESGAKGLHLLEPTLLGLGPFSLNPLADGFGGGFHVEDYA
jgi:hypothetical protein